MGPLTIQTLEGRTTELPQDTLGALRKQVDGKVLLPEDPGWEEATLLWNAMIDKQPALVVQPETTDDVAACVDVAREHGILISVKGGGHHIAGTALTDGGLTLDMSRLKRVDVDPEAQTARVQPGCLLQDVDRATQEHGLATVLGFISETGVAGLTLGGGFGYLSRRFGWTVDNLLEVEIVTADGQVRRASRDEHEDLFWAVRGAGHNLGIVTEFVFDLHDVGPEITGGLMAYPAETPDQVEAALEAYRDLTQAAPRELGSFVMFMRAPPAPFVPEAWHGRKVAGFLVCHTGPEEDVEQDLAPLTETLGDPVVDIVGPRPYTEQQALIDDTEPKGMDYYWKSEWHAELDEGLFEVLRDAVMELPNPLTRLGFVHIGGALNERPEDDGAVGNRDTRYGLAVIGMWEPGDPEGASYRAWVREVWEEVVPFSTGGHYINFETADEGQDRTRASYGKNFDRLVEVKTRYDPDNLFRSNRNVAPKG